MTVAASALAERAAFGHRSSRAVADHRGPSVFRPDKHDLDTGCGVCGIRRAFRAVSDRGCMGNAGTSSFVFQPVSEPGGVRAPIPEHLGDLWRAVLKCTGSNISNAIADLNGADERAGRSTLAIRRMACNLAFMSPLGRPTGRPRPLSTANRSPCDAPSDKPRRSRPPFPFRDWRPNPPSSGRRCPCRFTSLHRFHRFQRLQSVLCGPYPAGASRHLKALR